MNATLRDRVNAILSTAYGLNWEETSYSLEKALVCAELSALVYEDVPDYELKKASRIHLFASDSYRRAVEANTPTSVLSVLMEENFEAHFFMVRGRYSLVLGICLGDLVILAVRGTVFRRLWDWKANLDARKYHFPSDPYLIHPDFAYGSMEDQFFHKGFFESIVPQFPSIAEEIRKRMRENNHVKIVWTGHSLGGAMAAIGNAVSRSRLSHYALLDSLPGTVVDAYTFGMPRYCGLGSVCTFASPHHTFKKEDLVPTVPLRSMGFVDCCKEYELTDNGTVSLTERVDTFGIAGHVPKLKSSIQFHSIDGYADSLAKALGLQRPGAE